MAKSGHEWDPFFGPPVRAGGPPPSWSRGETIRFSSGKAPLAAPTVTAVNMIQPRAAWPEAREQEQHYQQNGLSQPDRGGESHPTYTPVPHAGLPAYQPANLAGYSPQYQQQQQQQQHLQPLADSCGAQELAIASTHPGDSVREQKSADGSSMSTMTVS
jgi:hypothetical protein